MMLFPLAQAPGNNASKHAGSWATCITPIPFNVIGKLFGIDKGAAHAHWQQYKEHTNAVLHA
jgi:oxalate decarboxylase/phosphoglucose isomerase-like protein (cupin superfamily)